MLFTKNKPTEPISFIFFKKICSLFLVITLIWYLIAQFLEYYESVSKPILTFKNGHLLSSSNIDDKNTPLTNYIIIQVCHTNITKINCTSYDIIYSNHFNECKNTINSDHCVRYELGFNYFSWIDISIKPSDRPIPNFNHTDFLDNPENSGMLSIYLIELKIDDKNYTTEFDKPFFLASDQVAI